MNYPADQDLQRLIGFSRRRALGAFAIGAAALALYSRAHADNFASVRYDMARDQLVVTVLYRGTNPDHLFSLHWGVCKDLADGSGKEIVAEVLDSQWQDAERRSFRKTTRFELTDLPCRPVTLTLRTAPRFYYALQIPAARSSRP